MSVCWELLESIGQGSDDWHKVGDDEIALSARLLFSSVGVCWQLFVANCKEHPKDIEDELGGVMWSSI